MKTMSNQDIINSPNHYKRKDGKEVIDVIADFFKEFAGEDHPMFAQRLMRAYCIGNIIKYTERAGRKPGEERETAYRKAAKYAEFIDKYSPDLPLNRAESELVWFVEETVKQ